MSDILALFVLLLVILYGGQIVERIEAAEKAVHTISQQCGKPNG